MTFRLRLSEEGDVKTRNIFTALSTHCSLRMQQQDHLGAVKLAEDGYNLVVEAYDCVHPLVQEAAGMLIQSFVAKDDMYNAERYAQITYSNLRDKKNGIDQESVDMANVSFSLA
jgi:hypothetical protein